MLEKMLIEHCSPTLGGLKTANLFSFQLSDREKLDSMLAVWNRKLNPKGVSLHTLGTKGNRILVYVCRASMLSGHLHRNGVQSFLRSYGYREFSVPLCIARLKERLLSSDSFPHEIGLFLGYPLEDVKGFIENGGQNYKFIGHWKVYCNAYEAAELFIKYRKCREIYKKLYENRGRSVYQLTVAVS